MILGMILLKTPEPLLAQKQKSRTSSKRVRNKSLKSYENWLKNLTTWWRRRSLPARKNFGISCAQIWLNTVCEHVSTPFFTPLNYPLPTKKPGNRNQRTLFGLHQPSRTWSSARVCKAEISLQQCMGQNVFRIHLRRVQRIPSVIFTKNEYKLRLKHINLDKELVTENALIVQNQFYTNISPKHSVAYKNSS